MSAELRVISRHTVTDFEALDVLHILSACDPHDGRYIGYTYLALGSNNTDGLVARNQRELGNELAFVDVLGSNVSMEPFSGRKVEDLLDTQFIPDLSTNR